MLTPTAPKVTKCRAWLWQRVRALFVVFHVASMLVLSLPKGTKLADRRRWRSQRTQREFQLWAKRLHGWGVDTDAAKLETKLWSASQRYLTIQRALAAPFLGYDRAGGMVQGWGMFRSPQRRPGVLRIEVFEAHHWQTVYLSRSAEHTYLASELDHNRIRKLVGRSARNGHIFNDLAQWIVKRTANDFPRARKARVTLERFDSLARADRLLGKKRKLVVGRRFRANLEALR